MVIMIAKAKMPSTATPRTIAHGTFLGASLTSSPVNMSVLSVESDYSFLTHMNHTIETCSLSAESMEKSCRTYWKVRTPQVAVQDTIGLHRSPTHSVL